MPLTSTPKISSTVVRIDPVYSVSNENTNKSNIYETYLNDTKGKDLCFTKLYRMYFSLEVDKRKTRTFISKFNNLNRNRFITSFNKLNLSIEPLNLDQSLTMIENILSPTLEQVNADNNINLQSCNDIRIERRRKIDNKLTKNNISNHLKSQTEGFPTSEFLYKKSSATNVLVEYVPRPKR
ncbi:unnamed protein product [Rotaria sp. Silwood2]|nr:unnamed protein product [Rotaria sp. Silwood2]